MGFLASIRHWLTSSSTAVPKKAHPDLRPLDVGKLAAELNLAPQAKRLGEAGIPAADATAPSGPEAAAIQRVEKARQDYVDWAVLRLGIINQSIGNDNLTRDVNRARQADQEFVRKASTILTEKDALLRSLGDAAKSRALELAEFRTRHRISREADYPSGLGSAVRWAVLVALVVIEGFVNATFFAQGLDTGLIGGAAYAMLLAAFNVTAACAAGTTVVRYANHKNPAFALAGWLAVAGALLLIGAIGLGIAHFRDALTSEMPNPDIAALRTLTASPFQLRDMMSWGLFGISVAFGVGALLDGLSMDDWYPGYGKISRVTRQAVDDYEDELSSLREELEELKNEELELLDTTLQRSQATLRSFAAAIEDKKVTRARLDTAFLDANNALAALLLQFRTENEVHRRGIPRPAYFNVTPELKPVDPPNFDTALDSSRLTQLHRDVDILLAEVQDIRGRIQAAFNQQFDRLKPLDLHFSGQEKP